MTGEVNGLQEVEDAVSARVRGHLNAWKGVPDWIGGWWLLCVFRLRRRYRVLALLIFGSRGFFWLPCFRTADHGLQPAQA